eukprot:CAMPEP_0202354740 /NCGR_PEP_ID=MMETSP1126-20121109/9931_1 /ASSEMBLY_ACC=CAM_ASM_000457 /TAXON_ID=3047 /ORGANISM="Dunaliella tertiolecta, Strain CCMP1320" /LENGTH=50 /DNA_ID=CAMNT_0048947251 /DNA_START=47 /DNA_END=197 /DNA_ORIENTATION=+
MNASLGPETSLSLSGMYASPRLSGMLGSGAPARGPPCSSCLQAAAAAAAA